MVAALKGDRGTRPGHVPDLQFERPGRRPTSTPIVARSSTVAPARSLGPLSSKDAPPINLRLSQPCTLVARNLHPDRAKMPHQLISGPECHSPPSAVSWLKGGLHPPMLGVVRLGRPHLLNQVTPLLSQPTSLARKALSSDWLPSRLPEALVHHLYPRVPLVVPSINLIWKS